MSILKMVTSGIREFFKESAKPSPEVIKARDLGRQAHFKGWHQNPYPKDSPLHDAWQEGHDTAKYYDENAW